MCMRLGLYGVDVCSTQYVCICAGVDGWWFLYHTHMRRWVYSRLRGACIEICCLNFVGVFLYDICCVTELAPSGWMVACKCIWDRPNLANSSTKAMTLEVMGDSAEPGGGPRAKGEAFWKDGQVLTTHQTLEDCFNLDVHNFLMKSLPPGWTGLSDIVGRAIGLPCDYHCVWGRDDPKGWRS